MINGSKNKTTDCPDCVHILLKGRVKQKKPQIHTNHVLFTALNFRTIFKLETFNRERKATEKWSHNGNYN